MFELIHAVVQVAVATVQGVLPETVGGRRQYAPCGAWRAIYARTWVYWWRLIILLLVLAMIETIAMLAHLTG